MPKLKELLTEEQLKALEEYGRDYLTQNFIQQLILNKSIEKYEES